MHRTALALMTLVLALGGPLGCASGSGSGSGSGGGGGIQSGGNGSGDAAPGDSQSGGSGSPGGLAGGSGGGGSGSAPAGGGSLRTFDPVRRPLHCMRVKKLRAYRSGPASIQVAPKPTGPSVTFASTTGDAEAAQIHGQAEGAELIGNALLFVRGASERVIHIMEDCLDSSSYSG